jgi:hypothetical protein
MEDEKYVIFEEKEGERLSPSPRYFDYLLFFPGDHMVPVVSD